MALKKTIAGYWKPINKVIKNEDGTSSHVNGKEWVEQYDIEMHPLEEESIKKHWAIHDEKIKVPSQPSKDEEHEWLVEHGADFVRLKRAEWQKIYDVQKPSIDKAHQDHQDAHKAWCDHQELCIANGHNPDAFVGDARESLKMPIKD